MFVCLMILRPPRSTRTDTLFPYTTRFRSDLVADRHPRLRRQHDRRDAPAIEARKAGLQQRHGMMRDGPGRQAVGDDERSEEHTSELQSLMRISYAVFCLNKTNMPHSSDHVVSLTTRQSNTHWTDIKK